MIPGTSSGPAASLSLLSDNNLSHIYLSSCQNLKQEAEIYGVWLCTKIVKKYPQKTCLMKPTENHGKHLGFVSMVYFAGILHIRVTPIGTNGNFAIDLVLFPQKSRRVLKGWGGGCFLGLD